MRRLKRGLAAVVGAPMVSASGLAQEGHPAKGSWIGTWEAGGQSARLLRGEGT